LKGFAGVSSDIIKIKATHSSQFALAIDRSKQQSVNVVGSAEFKLTELSRATIIKR